MTHVWENSKHSGGELLVLLALADHAGDHGVCWPSLQTLARKSRLQKRQVQNCVKALEVSGEIEILTAGKGRESTRYRVKCESSKICTGVTDCTSEVQPIATKPSIEPPLLLRGEEIKDWQNIDDIVFQIYQTYPLRVAKPKALASIKKQIELVPARMQRERAAEILEKTRIFATMMGTDLSFCPHPTTWFNQQRFNDDPSTWKRKNGTYQQGNARSSRTVGTSNEGRASQYANVGKVR